MDGFAGSIESGGNAFYIDFRNIDSFAFSRLNDENLVIIASILPSRPRFLARNLFVVALHFLILNVF